MIWDVLPDAAETVMYSEFYKARETGQSVSFEYHSPLRNRWFAVRVFPRDDGLTVYFRDVSDTVAKEEQLRQAQKMEAVGHLTGGIAHDFNNLLTVIIGNSEIIADGSRPGTQQHHLVSMIMQAADRAADLTQRLLAFSRRQPLAPKPTDINQLLQAFQPFLHRTLGERYEVAVLPHHEAAVALIDARQLENSVLNLVLNARDAMPGGGRITIEVAKVVLDGSYVEYHLDAAPGVYVMLAVSDRGIGMSAELQARVFEPFFTTKKVGEGTGLGLSMVYGFAQQSGGSVNIYSEVGEGTTVKMYLPSAAMDGAVDSAFLDVSPALGGSERILVVEDDELVRSYTVMTLIDLGYNVVAKWDGVSALKLLDADTKFELLLCDVILGGRMNGREVADAALALAPHLRVLFMSGYTEDVIVHHGRLDPNVRLLLKPFRRAELARKVRDLLDDPSHEPLTIEINTQHP